MLTKADLVNACVEQAERLLTVNDKRDLTEQMVDIILRTIITKAEGLRIRDDCRVLLGDLSLGSADRALPRHLAYPHLLILRERGYTKMVFADCGRGEFGVPSYRGDVITEVGEQWLKHQTGESRTAT